MKTIYYCAIQSIEVPEDMTDTEIDDLLCDIVNQDLKDGENPKDYMWSESKEKLLE